MGIRGGNLFRRHDKKNSKHCNAELTHIEEVLMQLFKLFQESGEMLSDYVLSFQLTNPLVDRGDIETGRVERLEGGQKKQSKKSIKIFRGPVFRRHFSLCAFNLKLLSLKKIVLHQKHL